MLNRRMMGAAALGLIGIGSAALAAQANERPDPFARGHWQGHPNARWNALSPEDRAAFTDARLAALRAGLKLTPDQEKLWPPVETAIRDLARQRDAQRTARRERGRMVDDAPAALRGMADAATARGRPCASWPMPPRRSSPPWMRARSAAPWCWPARCAPAVPGIIGVTAPAAIEPPRLIRGRSGGKPPRGVLRLPAERYGKTWRAGRS